MEQKKYTNGRLVISVGQQVEIDGTLWPSVTEGCLIRHGFHLVEDEPNPQPTAEGVHREQLSEAIRLKQNRISELEQILSDKDYIAIKIAEGEATPSDYADVIEQKRAWRAEINQLEAELKALEGGE